MSLLAEQAWRYAQDDERKLMVALAQGMDLSREPPVGAMWTTEELEAATGIPKAQRARPKVWRAGPYVLRAVAWARAHGETP